MSLKLIFRYQLKSLHVNDINLWAQNLDTRIAAGKNYDTNKKTTIQDSLS